MVEKLGYRSPSPLTTLAELESKIWKVNQMQTRAKIVSSNLKMTSPTKHAQLVSTIFELSITKRTVMCLTEGNLLILMTSTGAYYANYCKCGKYHCILKSWVIG